MYLDNNTEIETTISTNKGKYIFKNQSFENCDRKREIILLFDSYEIFIGFLYDFDEEEIILKNHSNHLIGLPINRCIGWSYADNPINELNEDKQ